MPVPLIRTFQGLQKSLRFKPKKEVNAGSSIRTTLRYDLVIPIVKFEGFFLQQEKPKTKMNWVRLAEHGRIPTNAKYMNPRISFDGLNWWISVCRIS